MTPSAFDSYTIPYMQAPFIDTYMQAPCMYHAHTIILLYNFIIYCECTCHTGNQILNCLVEGLRTRVAFNCPLILKMYWKWISHALEISPSNLVQWSSYNNMVFCPFFGDFPAFNLWLGHCVMAPCLHVRIMWAIYIGPVHVYMQVHAYVDSDTPSPQSWGQFATGTLLYYNKTCPWNKKVLVLSELSAIENHYYKPVHLYMLSLSGHASLHVQETILVMLYTDHTTSTVSCIFSIV